MTTAADIVNRALELAARNVQVSGVNPTFDGTIAGNAAGVLYTPVLQLLLRQLNPAFARRVGAEIGPALPGPIPTPWLYGYAYPADCLRLRQVSPEAPDRVEFDPRPVRAQVLFDGVNKIIGTDQQNALAAYTTSSASESQFDAAFAETFAHRLASPLAMALAGRPDFARELLEESMQFAQAAELMDE